MSSGFGRTLSRRALLKILGTAGIGVRAGVELLTPERFAAASQAPNVTFTDVTAPAGLMGARNVCGSAANKQFLLEEMGCGVALFDYDNDGWLDIFLVNATAFDA